MREKAEREKQEAVVGKSHPPWVPEISLEVIILKGIVVLLTRGKREYTYKVNILDMGQESQEGSRKYRR